MSKKVTESAKIEVEVEVASDTVKVAKTKKQRVLSKDLKSVPGCLVLSIVGIDGSITYNPEALPENVQVKLPAFALNHRLGDAASGKSGQEAADAIAKVWEGMMAGNWATKAPATKKIAISDIVKSLGNLSQEEQDKATAALAALGIVL